MKIYLIRHGKVDYEWSKWCNSMEFDKMCFEYDAANIKPIITNTNVAKGVQHLYVSELRRTHETVQALYPTMHFRINPLINEVPLKSAFDSNIKLPLVIWNICGRLQWMLNINRQQEIKRKTIDRATKVIKELSTKNKNCILITHGFYMHTLIKELKRYGYTVNNRHVSFSNLEVVEAVLE